jgi:ABC-2 type transport system permease protein
MSATTAPTALAARPDADVRPGLGRLMLVELRKMTDTRAGFWLLVAVAVITVVAMIIAVATGDAADHTLREILDITAQPAGILLPVVGILLVTSEWSQRTSLITFALVPHRGRVFLAKIAAALVLSVVALVFAILVAALGTAIAGADVPNVWSLPVEIVGQTWLVEATAMLVGLGFGAMLLASAPAIVLYFVVPTAWSALGSIKALHGVADWLDQGRSLRPLTLHALSATEWAHVGTTLALWLLVPLAVGMWRIRRSEIR